MPLTAPTFARRARCASAVPPRSLAVLVHSSGQQTRSFRFGRIWSSYLDPEFHRDIFRRRCGLRSRYAEHLYRRLSWDRHSLAEDTKSTLKRMVNSYWHADRKSGKAWERCMNTESSPRTPDNPEGIRPGQNIEDAERAPLEHLLFGGKRQRAKKNGQAGSAPVVAGKVEPDYVIDPITNRKVFKKSPENAYSTSEEGVDIPVTTFKPYRSQFSPFKAPEVEDAQAPIFYDGPPPEAELRMYSQVKIDDSGPCDSASQPNDGGSWRTTTANRKRSALDHGDTSHSGLLNGLDWEHKEVRWHQNDGIASASASSSAGSWTPSPRPTEYPDLHKYRPVMGNGDSNSDSSPEHDYKDLHKYGAVRSHEPDGKYKVESEPPVDQKELGKYGAFRSHEPDGKYAAKYVEPQPDAAELAQYRSPFFSHEPDGKYAANHVEVKPDSAELATYGPFRSHEPDGKYAPRAEALRTEPAESRPYQAFRSRESDGKYAAETAAASEAQDLAYHEAFGYEDAETKSSAQEADPINDAPDLQGYRTVQPDDLQRSSEPALEEGCHDPVELGKYEAVRWNEPDGKPAETDSVGQTLFEYDLKGPTTLTATEDEKTPYRKLVEELMARSAAESDVAENKSVPASESCGATAGGDRRPGQLTGNYVRDFPEDFARTWALDASSSTASLLPEQTESSSVMQPALERYNKEQTAVAPEAVQSGASRSIPPANATEPTLYKILVYDPTMQCIETAETTSVVPDSSAPLTPAEVLLRISNPAKFFPHFAPLQAQGYEIVSGSGDVLIFRKVREALSGGPRPQQASGPTEPAATSASVNPIDMTGEPCDYTVAAGRFGSPTGFVNYNLPPPNTAPPEAQVRTEEDAHREKAAVGGSKMEPESKDKTSLLKRVAVGAAWLAGISYSLGVVSEYFKTGGSDGKGPKGL